MYKIALCDDNTEYLKMAKTKIRDYCNSNGLNVILDTFDDSDKLAEYVEEKKRYDAYILDIDMPNVSGIELAEKVREFDEKAYVIFLTAYDMYAIKACGINVLSYILKDCVEMELDVVLKKLFEKLEFQKLDKTYVICNQRKYIKIQQKDIIYIYKDEKNVVFVLDGAKKEYDRTTLQKVYRQLDNPDMYFLDRSFIINLQHVKNIFTYIVNMKDGKEIAVSKEHSLKLKKHLMLYWEARV